MAQLSLESFTSRLAARTLLMPGERAALAGLPYDTRPLLPGQAFIEAGKVVQHVDIVSSGMAARFDITDEGARLLTALHLPGDPVNPRSIVQLRSSSGHIALVPTTIARVPITALRRVAARLPGVAEALWREAALEADITRQWMVNIGRRDSKTRIAHLLCELALRSGSREVAGEIVFPMPLTQEHLADITGLTPVHVNRVLRGLREENLVVLHDREAHILHWRRLVAAGEFRPNYLHIPATSEESLRLLDLS